MAPAGGGLLQTGTWLPGGDGGKDEKEEEVLHTGSFCSFIIL